MATAITINMNGIPAINSCRQKNGSKSNNKRNEIIIVNGNLTPAADQEGGGGSGEEGDNAVLCLVQQSAHSIRHRMVGRSMRFGRILMNDQFMGFNALAMANVR